MKIEKLTDNKIRIIVNSEELSNKNIDINHFFIDNIQSQKFFLDILNRAEKEIGFKTDNCQLLIESFTSLNDFFVFTITKFSKTALKKKNKYRVSSKTKIIKNPVYSFYSFEEFCELCDSLNKLKVPVIGIAKKINLYLYKNTYYIVFSDLNLNYTNFKRLFSVFSEFSSIVKNSDNFSLKLLEYGDIVIRHNALKTGIKYFVNN